MKFHVISISENTNSFGLRGVLLLSPQGEGHEILTNHLNTPKVGDAFERSEGRFLGVSYESPRALQSVGPSQARSILKEVRERVSSHE
jgi:hypothetical protein